jgi:hypothetical protein
MFTEAWYVCCHYSRHSLLSSLAVFPAVGATLFKCVFYWSMLKKLQRPPEDGDVSTPKYVLGQAINTRNYWHYMSVCICWYKLFIYVTTNLLSCYKVKRLWPRGLRSRSAAARLLGLWVRIPPGAWMFVCCECCVLSGRGLCEGLISCTEESYRVWCVWVWSWSLEKWGGLGPQGAVEPLGKKRLYDCIVCIYCN